MRQGFFLESKKLVKEKPGQLECFHWPSAINMKCMHTVWLLANACLEKTGKNKNFQY